MAKIETLERRKRICDLFLRGMPQWKIAIEIGCSESTVSRSLENLRVEWREDNAVLVQELAQHELAKVNLIEADAWAAWERSKANKERVTKERASGESAASSKVVVVTEGRLPDPRYLEIIMSCVKRRCEILNLDAPKEIRHSGQIGTPIDAETQKALIETMAKRLAAIANDHETPSNGDGLESAPEVRPAPDDRIPVEDLGWPGDGT